MNTSTFKEVFTASIKVLYLNNTISLSVTVMIINIRGFNYVSHIHQICISFFSQYLVERIHTNYALQVRDSQWFFFQNSL